MKKILSVLIITALALGIGLSIPKAKDQAIDPPIGSVITPNIDPPIGS